MRFIHVLFLALAMMGIFGLNACQLKKPVTPLCPAVVVTTATGTASPTPISTSIVTVTATATATRTVTATATATATASPIPACADRGRVTTLAGSGASGCVNATGTAASFSCPSDVAIDSAGNCYIADIFNHRIRKVAPGNVVTTLAGTGTTGHQNGAGTVATFNCPVGVAVDDAFNVYVADEYNHAIRKIAPDGTVSTFAGTGSGGFVNGTGTGASFNRPHGVAVDASGTLYVADRANHCVRKITSAGVVTTLAGNGTAGLVNGTGTSARLNDPTCICLDPWGNIYVADLGTHVIRKITQGGVVTTLAGAGMRGYADGTGTAAMFSQPIGLTSDSLGNIYVTDAENYLIRKVTQAGVVTTLAGQVGVAGYLDAVGTAALLNYPGGLDIDAAGDLVFVESNSRRMRKLDLCDE